jgi:hypothetical protein
MRSSVTSPPLRWLCAPLKSTVAPDLETWRGDFQPVRARRQVGDGEGTVISCCALLQHRALRAAQNQARAGDGTSRWFDDDDLSLQALRRRDRGRVRGGDENGTSELHQPTQNIRSHTHGHEEPRGI